MSRVPSMWGDLFDQALNIIDHVNRDGDILTEWSFGGGTALMLHLDHRTSHDVDLFVEDPQFLPYLVAAVADMNLELGGVTYTGDGSNFLKVVYPASGEIDFIVAGHMTDDCVRERKIRSRNVLLETVPEIIAKKIRYRGSSIQPRDIFDIAAAYTSGFDRQIESALARIPTYADAAARRLNVLTQDYIEQTLSQLNVHPDFEDLKPEALSIARDIVKRRQSESDPELKEDSGP